MTRIVLLRHGQTEWNRVERFRGRANLALDEVGLAQAEAAAAHIVGWQPVALYSSPLRRAVMTAQALAQRLTLPITPLEGLVDIDYGLWQGLSPEEAAERDPHRYRQWLEAPHLVRFPQGESLDEVRSRALAALDEVMARHRDQIAVMVSHKVVCKVLLCAVLGLDNSHFWQVEQDVCALNLIEVSERGRAVALLNDTCHLQEGQRG